MPSLGSAPLILSAVPPGAEKGWTLTPESLIQAPWRWWQPWAPVEAKAQPQLRTDEPLSPCFLLPLELVHSKTGVRILRKTTKYKLPNWISWRQSWLFTSTHYLWYCLLLEVLFSASPVVCLVLVQVYLECVSYKLALAMGTCHLPL